MSADSPIDLYDRSGCGSGVTGMDEECAKFMRTVNKPRVFLQWSYKWHTRVH